MPVLLPLCKQASEKREGTHKVSQKDLVYRYREKTGSYYNLTVTLTEEGAMAFNEGYYYPARGEEEG